MELEELMEINPMTILITLIAYGLCMLVLWKGVGGWELKTQIVISIAALPLIYFAVLYQMGR